MLADKQNLKAYNKIAPEWVRKNFNRKFWAGEYVFFQQLLRQGKVIDLGCGGGRDSLWFIKHGYDYLGVDFSKQMIKQAKLRNPKARFVCKSFYDLDFPKNSFDGFWAAASLLHVPKQKIKKVLKGIYEIIRPGGVGFIAVKEGRDQKLENWDKTQIKRFFSYYRTLEFQSLLKSAGFELIRSAKHKNLSQPQHDFLIFFMEKK